VLIEKWEGITAAGTAFGGFAGWWWITAIFSG